MLYVNKGKPSCPDSSHAMYVRDKKWQNNLQALKCEFCSTTVMVRVPDHISLAQGPKYAEGVCHKINKKEIQI